MKRRDILKAGAAGLAVLVAPKTGASAETLEAKPDAKKNIRQSYEKQPNLAAACGLYCGQCGDMKAGRCHGCGCTCGACVAGSHAEHCSIVKCVSHKNNDNCAECRNFACSKLIMHTHDPVWSEHAVCIENLQRRKAVGTGDWIAEQKTFWSDENNAKKGAFAEKESLTRVEKLKNEFGYTRPF